MRILRIARFAARFADFTVADETLALMRRMVDAGEVDALVPERVGIARGLMEAKPSRMFAVLRECGALARILPEVDALWARRLPPGSRHGRARDDGRRLCGEAGLFAAGALRGAHARSRQATTPADVLPRHVGHEGRSVDLLAVVRAAARAERMPRSRAGRRARARQPASRDGDGRGRAGAAVRAQRRAARRRVSPRCCRRANRMRAGGSPTRSRIRRPSGCASRSPRSVDAGARARHRQRYGEDQDAVHRARIEAVAHALEIGE